MKKQTDEREREVAPRAQAKHAEPPASDATESEVFTFDGGDGGAGFPNLDGSGGGRFPAIDGSGGDKHASATE